MKNIFTTCFFSLMIINTFGQVSIGNENTPNSEVILDLRNSDGKGLLLPKKNSSVTEPLGNIFYNSSKNMIGVVDEEVKTVQCKKESKKGCNSKTTKCITHNLWDELEIHINNFFEQKNLKDLINNSSESRN